MMRTTQFQLSKIRSFLVAEDVGRISTPMLLSSTMDTDGAVTCAI